MLQDDDDGDESEPAFQPYKETAAAASSSNQTSAQDLASTLRGDGRGGGGPDVEGSFDPDKVLAPKDQRRVDDFILYAIAAADEAVRDAGWAEPGEDECERTGVILGSGIGGLNTIAATTLELEAKGPRRVSPFFIPSALINLASGHVSIRYGYKGPNHAVVTACAPRAPPHRAPARRVK